MTSTDDPKKFWQYIKSQRRNNPGVQVLKIEDIDITGDKEKVEALANQFSRDESSQLPCLPDSSYPDMPDIEVSVEGLLKLLKSVDVFKAAAPDQIPNRALKWAADEIAPILITRIFQQSLDTGELPVDWETANITPLFKMGATSDPANYRPVSLTSVCCKLLEQIVDRQLMEHLDQHQILAENQHALRRGRSCESQLMLAFNDLAYNHNSGITTDVAVLDFSKAFDVVPFFMRSIIMASEARQRNGWPHF